jgi:hypothetical protein
MCDDFSNSMTYVGKSQIPSCVEDLQPIAEAWGGAYDVVAILPARHPCSDPTWSHSRQSTLPRWILIRRSATSSPELDSSARPPTITSTWWSWERISSCPQVSAWLWSLTTVGDPGFHSLVFASLWGKRAINGGVGGGRVGGYDGGRVLWC